MVTKTNKQIHKNKKTKKVTFALNNTSIKLFNNNYIIMPNFKSKYSIPLNQTKIFKKNLYIELLQKIEFDIWYDTKLKYPLLVAQPINEKTFEQNNDIRRDLVGDSFTPDINSKVSKRETFTEEDYKIYMEYGGSMGHNAPASYHKTNIDTYKETFLLSNVCPQEIVLNSGVWVLLETWCRDFYLHGHTKIKDLIIFTGSIKSRTTNIFKSYIKEGKSVKMNVPTHMYKIIMYKSPNGKLTSFAFLFKNKPIYIRDGTKYYDMSRHMIALNKLCDMSGISLHYLLNYYSQKTNSVSELDEKDIIKTHELFRFIKKQKFRFQINRYFTTQMARSEYYGRLVYSKTMEELEKHWTIVKRRQDEFKNIDFHREYYEMANIRLNKTK
jgi:DNA/RNA endonuclease G (NUC1)